MSVPLRRRAADATASFLLRLPNAFSPQAAQRLAPGLGRMMHRLDWSRHRVYDNFNLAFGDTMSAEEKARLADRFYAHLVLLTCEIVWLRRWSEKELLSRCRPIIGAHHLEESRKAGKGAIVVGGHTGNWEVMAALGTRAFPGFSVVVRSQGESPIEDHIVATRRLHDVPVIQDASPRGALESLRNNGSLFLLIDRRHAERGGICVPFFGHPATSAPGPARLALKTGAPVHLGSYWRLPDGTFQAEVSPALPLIRTGDLERDLWLNTAQYQAALEEAIRRHPEQWIWHRRRWRLRRWEPGKLYQEMLALGEPGASLARLEHPEKQPQLAVL